MSLAPTFTWVNDYEINSPPTPKRPSGRFGVKIGGLFFTDYIFRQLPEGAILKTEMIANIPIVIPSSVKKARSLLAIIA